MHRTAVLQISLLVLALFGIPSNNAKVISEIVQAGEMGVEQADTFVGSSNVMFFAVARGGFDFSEQKYILSFGFPTVEDSCAQSQTGVCTDNMTITPGWESVVIAHYPPSNPSGGLYIRRSMNILDPEECSNSGITRREINDTTVEISGTLVLSSFTDCLSTQPFLHVRTYPFLITYNLTSGVIEGLEYSLLSYSYTTKTKRIIDSEVYGTLIEIEVVTERLIDDALIENTTSVALPSRLSGATVVMQDTNENLMLAAISQCQEQTGVICTQSIFFALNNTHLFTTVGNISGSLELKVKVITPNDDFQSVVQLRAYFDLDTKIETGDLSRLYDVFMSVEGGFFSALKLYVKDAENSTQLTLYSTNCVNIIRLDHQHLDVHSIFLYADDPEDEEKTILIALYVPGRISLGSYVIDNDWSARFCFTYSSLFTRAGLDLLDYYVQVDYGQRSDVQFFKALDAAGEASQQTMEADPLTGVMTMQKRSLYNAGQSQSLTVQQDEVSDPQLLYFGCPYASQCYYHGYCVHCDGWDNDDVTTGVWVFLSAIVVVALVGLVAICACYNSPDSMSTKSSKADK